MTSDERKELDTLYNEVRHTLADMHTQATEQENPAQKILALIMDGLNTGEIVIEGKPLPGYGFSIKEMRRCTSCGNDHKQSFYFLRECRNLDNQPAYHCEACGEFFLIEGVPRGYGLDGFPLKANPQIIGFYCNPSRGGEPAVALYPQAVWTYIQKTLSIRGERINHNAHDIWAQLYSGGYLTRIQQGKRKRYDPMTYNAITGGKKRALNIKPVYVLGEPPKEPQPVKSPLHQSPPPPEYYKTPEVQDHDFMTSGAQNSVGTVDGFYRDCVTASHNSAPNQTEVYKTYLEWCAEESRTPISKANFNYEFSQYVETDEAQWIGIEVGYNRPGLF